MCALFATGLLLAIIGRGFLGLSLVPFAVAHRTVGWISFAVFVILLLTGGIRAIDDPWRAVTIGAHFFLGYIFYILNGKFLIMAIILSVPRNEMRNDLGLCFTLVVAVITSLYIPGSPSADHDESSEISDSSGKADRLGFVLGAWVIFELVMHISMTVSIEQYK